MTRINVVPPSELCDEHLRAEHRELTRIPNSIATGKLSDPAKIPDKYKLGAGHVYFFSDKLSWLSDRYQSLISELKLRGFKHENRWPDDLPALPSIFNSYDPDNEALEINRARIKDRWPKNAHYFSKKYQQSTNGNIYA